MGAADAAAAGEWIRLRPRGRRDAPAARSHHGQSGEAHQSLRHHRRADVHVRSSERGYGRQHRLRCVPRAGEPAAAERHHECLARTRRTRRHHEECSAGAAGLECARRDGAVHQGVSGRHEKSSDADFCRADGHLRFAAPRSQRRAGHRGGRDDLHRQPRAPERTLGLSRRRECRSDTEVERLAAKPFQRRLRRPPPRRHLHRRHHRRRRSLGQSARLWRCNRSFHRLARCVARQHDHTARSPATTTPTDI